MNRQEISKNKKIDVHSHFFAPELWKICEEVLGSSDKSAVFVRVKESSTQMQRFAPEERLRWMDKFGIEKSICSFCDCCCY